MDCRQAEPLLATWMDGSGSLGSPEEVEVEGHVASCGSCRGHLAELRALQEQVRLMPTPSLPDDFRQRFHLALAAEPLPVRPWHRRLRDGLNWPSLALGAVSAAALTFFLWRAPDPGIILEAKAVPVGQDVAVQVAFEVQEDVRDVTFDVRLPEGLRFVDAKGHDVVETHVTWQGELRKGRTVVPIAVRALQPGRWEITAVVRKDRSIRETHIVLPVTQPGQTLKPAHQGGDA
ncbi:MAG: zf-HC2 domain-containing protein [Candidatus Sericytochromatia bacterium]|nr:zf-HC2 domain-containing protein [Candidatus Tanganyikabacteria bacterium]